MNARPVAIYGLHGASHTCPADTIESYWAALGAGADGIVANVELTGDGTPVCCPGPLLKDVKETEHRVTDLSDGELGRLDAGAWFHSTALDEQHQPTNHLGHDHPWRASSAEEQRRGEELFKETGRSYKPKRALRHPTLLQVLQLFGRRTHVLLMLRCDQGVEPSRKLVDATLRVLWKTGLARRVVLIAPRNMCEHIHKRSEHTEVALIAPKHKTLVEALKVAADAGASCLWFNVEELPDDKELQRANPALPVLLASQTMPFAPTPDLFHRLAWRPWVKGLCFPAVEELVAMRTPPACVLSDQFEGPHIDQQLWACGYSHQNQETRISGGGALVIDIAEGREYSGAAAVTQLPVHDRFDARVEFHVARPARGTTFELAAIGIDPGHFVIDNSDLDSTSVNLTFDVHGAPPYASCERDQDDGFRIGWNNGFNLTKIDPDWDSSSGNMYNKYGRDVGDGTAGSPFGMLRLVRTGAVFNAYYKDKHNSAWVCCGSALVPNLGPDVHLRLGAKHWNKDAGTRPKSRPPANTVTFTKFELYQF